MRNDNLTNFAYVGPQDGQQQPPELYTAFRPSSPADPTPIQPGETAQLMNQQTGKYCRVERFPAGYISPTTCNTQGIICDQDTLTTATILTYTGYGISYNGVPLVQVPPSNTLVLSADPACTVVNGDKFTFPPAVLCELLAWTIQLTPAWLHGCAAPALQPLLRVSNGCLLEINPFQVDNDRPAPTNCKHKGKKP